MIGIKHCSADLGGQTSGATSQSHGGRRQKKLQQSKEAQEIRRSVDEARDALAAKFDKHMKTLCARTTDSIQDANVAS